MRGVGISKTTEKWLPGHNGPAKYHVRWTGEVAMQRDHLIRPIGESGQTEGDGRHEMLNMARIDIGKIESDWGVQRDETDDSTKSPLLTYEEWGMISRISDLNWKRRG